MNRNGRPFVWLVVAVCTSALAVNSVAEDPPPKTTSLTSAASGGVMEGLLNTEIVQGPGVTRNTERGIGFVEPRLVMTNMGKPVYMYPHAGQSAENHACGGDRAMVFDLSPGTAAPPTMLGGYYMTPFPLNDEDPPPGSAVTSVTSPCGSGAIEFSIPLSHRRIQGADGYGWWGSWSHGYTGDVYFTDGEASVTITLPQPACAFYFYVEPNPFGVTYFTATANDGTSSGSFGVEGEAGAAYVGIFGDSLETITISSDDGTTDFAIGEFGIACVCAPAIVACCDEATGDCVDSVELLTCIDQGGRWEIGVEFCADLDPPCGQQVGACCVGPAGEPPYDPYECIGDMTHSACLAAGEETFWTAGESCAASPPFDCGAPTYCDGSGGCDEHISNVYLVHDTGTIDNDSTCTGYGDYTDQVAVMTLGMSYDITVTNGSYYDTDITTVWVDWNGDKDWADDGEMVWSYDPGGTVATGTINVPVTAVSGYTRMRVRLQYGGAAEPCGSTSYGEVEDYMVLISSEMPTGSCCDPYTGICNDNVEAIDCQAPLQFGYQMTCAELVPPCGNPGACCDDMSSVCDDDVLELNCAGTRFAGGELCADFDPACGDVEFVFVFDPDTDPPPAMQCGCSMTPFPLNDEDPPPGSYVSSVSSPCPAGGDVEFSIPLSHRRIEGSGGYGWWGSWSHDYMGDVYFTDGATEVTLTLPPASCGFYVYVEPNPFDPHTFKLTVNGTIESDEFIAHGDHGAAYAGVCGAGLQTITITCVSGADFAIGEFGICCDCGPAYGACCDPYTGTCTDNVEVMDCLPPLQWTYDTLCADLYPPCGNPGACCNIYTGECDDDVFELNCPDGYRFEAGEQCAEMEPECGTPGACCDDEAADCWSEYQVNCPGRFVPGATCEPDPFDPPCGEWECNGILYAPSQADNPTWRAQVAALTGQPCDYWDTSVSTPTLDDLRDYCCVFTWVNAAYNDPVAFGDVLAQYVDGGGKVILGQWAYETTQNNWLEGQIMEPAYCPITATSYGPDFYVDGSGTDCIFCNVHELSGDYFDQCTVVAGAMSDGLLSGGLLAAAWRNDRRVYYAPGNTGGDFTTGDTAEMVANMCGCTGPVVLGACCDPTTGVCTDDVSCNDCLPPLQFTIGATCADLDPPCGDPGCCCDPEDGVTPLEPYEEFAANCAGRFLSGVLGGDCTGAAFDPECGLYAACEHQIVMWDDYGDGWNGGFFDLYVDGDLVLAGVTLASGFGPESVFFEAGTGAAIQTVWTDGGWPYEASYYMYDLYGTELCSDGVGGAYPTGVTCTGNCEPPTGGCCLGYAGCQVITSDDCAAAGGDYLGDFTDCGDLADCDEDGMTDLCAIQVYGAPDCNNNEIPDNCDIADCGPSVEPCDENAWCQDCQGDGIPDGCQLAEPPLIGGTRDPLISQPPNQSNGIFSDCDCDACDQGQQVLAENFVLAEETTIETVRFWGGMHPSDHTPANEWYIAFYEDAAGYPGTEIASYEALTGNMVQTGITLFGVHEWDVSVMLDTPLTLAAGTYFVAVYVNSVGDSDSWFWEVGDVDPLAGITGQAYGFECPPAFPYYDVDTDMAFELYAATGPPANDCNGNCVPDECDIWPLCTGPECSKDCNWNGIPDECEEEPVPCVYELITEQDTFLRQPLPHRNEGANPRLRVRSFFTNHSVVGFDLSEAPTDGLVTATLQLTVDDSFPDHGWWWWWWPWGGGCVGVHRLTAPWVEGNGKDAGLPWCERTLGNGPGATWACAIDPEIEHWWVNCPWEEWWYGGTYAAPTALPVYHDDFTTGAVEWNVTQDVLNAFAGEPFEGWLVKKVDGGWWSWFGKVYYYSREGAAEMADLSLAPRLILNYDAQTPAPAMGCDLYVSANVADVVIGVNPGIDRVPPFDTTYPDGSVVTLTAPASFNHWPFAGWELNAAPLPSSDPTLQVVLEDTTFVRAVYDVDAQVPDDAEDCLEALDPPWVPGVLSVGSNKLSVWVEVDEPDVCGATDGFAAFERVYEPGTSVTLTIPLSLSTDRRFVCWKINGVPQTAGLRTIQVVVDEGVAVEAVYTAKDKPLPISEELPEREMRDLSDH